MSEELRVAYALKEAYSLWFQEAKEIGTSAHNKVKEGLYNFYRQVESSSLKEFHQAIQTFKNWQIEILNSFAFNYNNGFVEGCDRQVE
nr:transposase [Rossellomorea aquimaris]